MTTSLNAGFACLEVGDSDLPNMKVLAREVAAHALGTHHFARVECLDGGYAGHQGGREIVGARREKVGAIYESLL